MIVVVNYFVIFIEILVRFFLDIVFLFNVFFFSFCVKVLMIWLFLVKLVSYKFLRKLRLLGV